MNGKRNTCAHLHFFLINIINNLHFYFSYLNHKISYVNASMKCSILKFFKLLLDDEIPAQENTRNNVNKNIYFFMMLLNYETSLVYIYKSNLSATYFTNVGK